MKIYKMYISNFRGYKDRTEIELDDFTAFIGKNDAGKSTILVALDIFFNESKGKLDNEDLCVMHDDGNDIITIEVVFSDIPEKLIIDSSAETDLNSEKLLTNEKKLHIIKEYKFGKLVSTYINAHYPIIEEGNLHLMKITELKKIVEKRELNCNKSISSEMRKAIFNSYDDVSYEDLKIEISKEGTKQIYEALSNYFPVYYLFKSDRENSEKDEEIQNPLSIAIKEALGKPEIKSKLDEVYKEIYEATNTLMNNTLKKLADMDEELAGELIPDFEQPTWKSAFKIGLNTENNISINKRGSGVRRLVLLNFFRAKVEECLSDKPDANLIYAIEEPETALHPEQQKILIECLLRLSQNCNNQILITTHSPAIARLLPLNTLRFISKNENKLVVGMPSEDILKTICDELGIIADVEIANISNVKVAVCLEGPTDVKFFEKVNEISELKDIIDLTSEEVIILPLGGSCLKHWVNSNYLNKLNLSQVHIYDSDIGSNNEHKYQKIIEKLKNQINCNAFETKFREIENYVSPSILNEVDDFVRMETVNEEWGKVDVPLKLAINRYNVSANGKQWEELDEEKKKSKVSREKKYIADNLYSKITKNTLEEIGAFNEITSWFWAIKNLVR